MCYILKFEDFGDIPASEVQECIEELCRPVLQEVSWLILEQSASHVIRTMLSVLTGIPVVAEKKVCPNFLDLSFILCLPSIASDVR
jgi:hypothetical protein